MGSKEGKCRRRWFRREATHVPLQILHLLLKPPPSYSPHRELLRVQQRSITRFADHQHVSDSRRLSKSQRLSSRRRRHVQPMHGTRGLELGSNPAPGLRAAIFRDLLGRREPSATGDCRATNDSLLSARALNLLRLIFPRSTPSPTFRCLQRYD
jgi:hypothetical protein